MLFLVSAATLKGTAKQTGYSPENGKNGVMFKKQDLSRNWACLVYKRKTEVGHMISCPVYKKLEKNTNCSPCYLKVALQVNSTTFSKGFKWEPLKTSVCLSAAGFHGIFWSSSFYKNWQENQGSETSQIQLCLSNMEEQVIWQLRDLPSLTRRWLENTNGCSSFLVTDKLNQLVLIQSVLWLGSLTRLPVQRCWTTFGDRFLKRLKSNGGNCAPSLRTLSRGLSLHLISHGEPGDLRDGAISCTLMILSSVCFYS